MEYRPTREAQSTSPIGLPMPNRPCPTPWFCQFGHGVHFVMLELSMDYACSMLGLCMDYAWITHELCLDYEGLFTDYAWITHGVRMPYGWSVHGLIMPRICRDYARILLGLWLDSARWENTEKCRVRHGPGLFHVRGVQKSCLRDHKSLQKVCKMYLSIKCPF